MHEFHTQWTQADSLLPSLEFFYLLPLKFNILMATKGNFLFFFFIDNLILFSRYLNLQVLIFLYVTANGKALLVMRTFKKFVSINSFLPRN